MHVWSQARLGMWEKGEVENMLSEILSNSSRISANKAMNLVHNFPILCSDRRLGEYIIKGYFRFREYSILENSIFLLKFSIEVHLQSVSNTFCVLNKFDQKYDVRCLDQQWTIFHILYRIDFGIFGYVQSRNSGECTNFAHIQIRNIFNKILLCVLLRQNLMLHLKFIVSRQRNQYIISLKNIHKKCTPFLDILKKKPGLWTCAALRFLL